MKDDHKMHMFSRNNMLHCVVGISFDNREAHFFYSHDLDIKVISTVYAHKT